jgi:hypothetical protein
LGDTPKPPVHLVERLCVAAAALFFLVAPYSGDLGCFANSAADLDPNKFFLAKQQDDCAACSDCGFATLACMRACRPPMGGTFPDQCYPLVQDGEVCLHALEAASCTDYQSYVSDQDPTVPTECDFCPPRDAGAE